MDKSTSLTEHGLFWLKDKDERKLWGTLYVNEQHEARLETFGSLIDPEEEALNVIVGRIKEGQEWVTLIGCFPTNTRNPWSSEDGQTDWSHQTYLVNGVVKGICCEEEENIAFEKSVLSISTLPKWANPNQVKLEFAKGVTGPNRVKLSILERADETKRVHFREEEINISVKFCPKVEPHLQGKITRYFVEDSCYLMVEKSDGGKMSLKGILSIAKTMQDLLSICCNETSKVTNISVFNGEGEPKSAKVYVRTWGNDVERKKGRPYPAVDLEGLGGMEGVARWFEVTERYGVAVALLTSNWFNDNAYNEDKFFRMYTAVEGLLSKKKNRNRANMKSAELGKFVEENIPGFTRITNQQPDKWSNTVKDLRDQRISHLDPTSSIGADGRMMQVVANVLYAAGASFLLKEIGMGEKQIQKYIRECNQCLLFKE